MSRGDGRIFLRGNTYWLQYSERGKQIRASANTNDPKKADKELKKRVGAILNGIPRDNRKVTYERMRANYYADYEVNERKSLRRDKEGNPHLDKVARLDDFFRGRRATDIDAALIRQYTKEQKAKGLSGGSVNRSISALRTMFYLAKEDDILTNVPHFPMTKESAPRRGFFEPEQYAALARTLPDYLRLPVAIGYYSGMRLGEILSLKWKDKDNEGLEFKQIDIEGGFINLGPDETKNGEARLVPIVPQLEALLLEQSKKRQPGCAYVCFRLDSAGRAVKIDSFAKAWRSACVKAGLGKMVPVIDAEGSPLYAKRRDDRPRSKPQVKMVYRGSIFHDLRRTGVRNLVNAGISDKIAMEISGHKTRSVFDRYNIVSKKNIAEARQKLADHLTKNGDNSGTMCTEMVQSSLVN
jgi:integrase